MMMLMVRGMAIISFITVMDTAIIRTTGDQGVISQINYCSSNSSTKVAAISTTIMTRVFTIASASDLLIVVMVRIIAIHPKVIIIIIAMFINMVAIGIITKTVVIVAAVKDRIIIIIIIAAN